MKDAFQTGRSKLRTALIVVVPSAILIVGTSLVSMAALATSEAAFELNWIIWVGGFVVVLTMALVTIIFIDRPKRPGRGHEQPSPDP